MSRLLKRCRPAREAGVNVFASFVIGLPGESPETMAETRTFAEGLGIDCGFHLLAPFPGTTVREEQEKYDIEILTDDWDLYDANVPIVRTSRVNETYIADFLKAYEARTLPFGTTWSKGMKKEYALMTKACAWPATTACTWSSNC